MPFPLNIRQIVNPDPLLGFRFGVFFFKSNGILNPLDIRFKRVSGIGATISVDAYQLPEEVKYDNLLLERGLTVGSLLSVEFDIAMSQFKFSPANVLISLLDESGIPISSWLFMKAYPVKWRISDLDADQNQVVIETMELAYQRMQPIRI